MDGWRENVKNYLFPQSNLAGQPRELDTLQESSIGASAELWVSHWYHQSLSKRGQLPESIEAHNYSLQIPLPDELHDTLYNFTFLNFPPDYQSSMTPSIIRPLPRDMFSRFLFFHISIPMIFGVIYFFFLYICMQAVFSFLRWKFWNLVGYTTGNLEFKFSCS